MDSLFFTIVMHFASGSWHTLNAESYHIPAFTVELATKGMAYLHASPLHCHGNLNSKKCVVSSHWVLMVSEFDHGILPPADLTPISTDADHKEGLLWTAPERLRGEEGVSKKGDIYSFAIILQEILYQAQPFFLDTSPLCPKG